MERESVNKEDEFLTALSKIKLEKMTEEQVEEVLAQGILFNFHIISIYIVYLFKLKLNQ